ncbi:hypothetical protein E2562_038530 [Oryza meyeriana var. granulata]|uniref:Uncharacterized protein n=1 Tax=Oryza meyeriana var. granulata TaxID=110450 RepID=A0A6G1BP80_9ORYZ|nr:hypothetical protein E2562_038530 [Oryza meyeriana var. granulata]
MDKIGYLPFSSKSLLTTLLVLDPATLAQPAKPCEQPMYAHVNSTPPCHHTRLLILLLPMMV